MNFMLILYGIIPHGCLYHLEKNSINIPYTQDMKAKYEAIPESERTVAHTGPLS